MCMYIYIYIYCCVAADPPVKCCCLGLRSSRRIRLLSIAVSSPMLLSLRI